jgi:hypothetical protein
MANLTPYFPQLRAQCAPLGVALRRAGQATDSLSGLAALFGGYFTGLLVPAKTGAGSRQRELPRVAVFWAFLGQVLLRGATCRWALMRLQADAVARGHEPPDDNTSAYCQARKVLSLFWLQTLFAALNRWFEPRTKAQWWGRVVRLIDATGFSMPDTEENRRRWPYAGRQKPGCGFPTGKLVGLFCLHTGRLIAWVEASWKTHDVKLARRLLATLRAGEVLVADRAYCGWLFLVQLLAQKVDFVIRLHQARHVRPGRARSWRETWLKPTRPPGMSRRAWKKQPPSLLVRLVRFQVQARGYFAARRQGLPRLRHCGPLRPALAGRTPFSPDQNQPRARRPARPLARYSRTRTVAARHRLQPHPRFALGRGHHARRPLGTSQLQGRPRRLARLGRPGFPLPPPSSSGPAHPACPHCQRSGAPAP